MAGSSQIRKPRPMEVVSYLSPYFTENSSEVPRYLGLYLETTRTLHCVESILGTFYTYFPPVGTLNSTASHYLPPSFETSTVTFVPNSDSAGSAFH